MWIISGGWWTRRPTTDEHPLRFGPRTGRTKWPASRAGHCPAQCRSKAKRPSYRSPAAELEVVVAGLARHPRRREGASAVGRLLAERVARRLVAALLAGHRIRGAGNQHRGGQEGDDRLHGPSPLLFGPRSPLYP